ncbi:hypothetical protein ACFYTQ_15035 [Nocardia sp. NPDC004068]|uniref:hypothetical protein n=1 Tax=Nocardia sp. NPDC004068 TaxID=3364303 RepID=UPI00369C4F08
MEILRKYRRSARTVTVLGALGAALAVAAGPAFAANSIDVTGVGPINIGVNYSCDADAGVVAVKVMVGDPQADQPSATGSETGVVCDGQQQSTVVVLTGAGLAAGQTVQVRAALVDRDDTVVSGQAKVFELR